MDQSDLNQLSQLEQHSDYQEMLREHPIKAKLTEALVRRMLAAYEAVMKGSEGLPEFNRLSTEFKEIASWLPGEATLEPEKIRRTAEKIVKDGICWEIAQTYVHAVSTAAPGRPSTRRRALAVEALEIKKAKDLSWQRIAINLNYCTDIKSREFKCRERLRRQVGELKKLLSKYGISY